MKENDFLEKVLVISPEFYSYRYKIEKAIEVYLACSVESYCERPKGFLYNLARTFSPKIKSYFEKNHLKMILDKIKGTEFDLVLIIRGEIIDREFLLELRKLNPEARFINYQWDSVYNNENILRIKSSFDVVASFDIEDCNNYGFKYIPLFFVEKDNTVVSINTLSNSIGFIGSYHGNRLIILQELESHFEKNGFKLNYKLYISKLAYLKNLFSMNCIPLKSVFFKIMTNKEIDQYYSANQFVLELPSSKQSGVPLRLFESLSLGKNVIVNDLDLELLEIDDLSSYLIDIKDFSVDTNAVEVDMNIISKYGLEVWVKKVISL